MTPQQLEDFLQADNWYDSRGHAFVLYGICRAMARTMGEIKVLEIGLREGSTAIPMLAGIKAGGKGLLVSIDNNSDPKANAYQVATERIERCGLADSWEFHLANSHTWESPYSNYNLILIDASHSYPDVKGEFDRYSPMLAKHGLITFHDTETSPEVHTFAMELSNAGEWLSVTLPFYNGLTIARRRSDWENGDRFSYVESFKW